MASPRSPRSPSSAASPRQDSPQSSKSIVWDAEIDSDTLFTDHTVEEIRVLESKARGDIEKKKEELRLMVGERYRDLIDAADTVTEMKDFTKKIKVSIDDIQHQCKDLHQSHRCHGLGGSSKLPVVSPQTKSGFYSLAAQMKLLVDTPEKIWSALERHQYLKAARLYLLSHHIVSVLHLDSGTAAAPKVLSSFPILQRQWAAISHFKDSIIQGSRFLLKDATQPAEVVTEALCSILLLEESSPRQVFSEFILARKAALQEIFHPSQHSTSIRSQVCELIRVIRTSLYQIYSLFVCDVQNSDQIHEIKDNPALLFKSLHQVTKRNNSDPNSDEEALEALFGPDFDLVTSARYLPKSVLEFRPHLRAFSATIPLHNIQSNCEEWITMCQKDVSYGVTKLLKYIGALKGLASIRDAVWDLLKEYDTSVIQDHQGLDWDQLCQKVVNHEVSLWDMFMRQPFLGRAKDILHGLFEATITSCQHMMTQSQDDLSDTNDINVIFERDISSYVWHESPNDIPLASLWGTHSSGTKQWGQAGGGLTLKAQGCTPVVRSLCMTLNDRLTATLEDAQYFITKSKDQKTPEKQRSSVTGRVEDIGIITNVKECVETEPFDRYGDAKCIQSYLEDTCFNAFNRLLTYVSEVLDDHKNKLKSSKSAYDTTYIDRILLVGRFCTCLLEQSPQLKLVMKGNEQTTSNRQTTPRISRQSSLSKRKSEQEYNIKLKELSRLLRHRYFDAFRLWKDWVCDFFLLSYENSLIKGGTQSALSSMTSWEELKIEEESETGSKVQSTIRVPMQVSSFVTSLLFTVCQELNRVGGHSLDKKLLQELIDTLSSGVLTLYERLVEEYQSSLTQNRALQYLFDFKFVMSIFGGRSEEPIQESTESFSVRKEAVIDCLEGVVDPFDLDVFAPYLNTNITRQLLRCGVLFGILVSMDKHSNNSFGATSRPSSSQDQHNIMPLAPSPPRFTLLPLSSHQNSLFQSTTDQETRKLDGTGETYSSVENSTPFFKHYKFFDARRSLLEAL